MMQALQNGFTISSHTTPQAHAVAAHAAWGSVLSEYSCRVREYMRVIRCTLVSETALRFSRLAIDSFAAWLMLAAGLRAVLTNSISLGALIAFYSYADVFAQGCTGAQEKREDEQWHYLIGREGALRDVSFHVPAGSSLAIVGPSGKSTLIKLMLRLYDPDEGQVLLDGVDIRTLDLSWLRSRFGYVPQQPQLFDASISQNVCFGETQSIPEDQIERALKASISFVDPTLSLHLP
ncbi:MAG: hypothetical protein SGPRY_008374 [Prymnesium sp.]